jgi:hypothetical protein
MTDTKDDDLKKRLRKKRERCHDLSGVTWTEDMDCQEAADRIEELEAKLAGAVAECERIGRLWHDTEVKLEKAVELLLSRGQGVREDGGGFFVRCIMTLFGKKQAEAALDKMLVVIRGGGQPDAKP